jgi:DNA gyrase inhibitor GyrI
MFVDIVLKHDRKYNVIAKGKVGPYIGANNLRAEFRALTKWAKKNNVKTGKWLFYELDGPDVASSKRRWEACLEVIGKLPKDKLPTRDISYKTLPGLFVASVTYDPDKFSSRLVYHGLECWLEWRTKYGELRENGPTREVYIGDPWTSPKAWANSEVQVPVAKMKKA